MVGIEYAIAREHCPQDARLLVGQRHHGLLPADTFLREAAYASASQATIPDDLQEALDASKQAKAFFATLSGRNRYAVLFRIRNAKKAEARARKIARFVDMLAHGETHHP